MKPSANRCGFRWIIASAIPLRQSRSPASVAVDVLPGDEISLNRGKEDGQVCDVDRLDPALQALAIENPLVVGFAPRPEVPPFGVRHDGTGRDAVDVDAVMSEFTRHRFDEAVHGPF